MLTSTNLFKILESHKNKFARTGWSMASLDNDVQTALEQSYT